ncbi:hypothetical protein V502_03357 [Pseudogymnoascus sp. VKM F-4520 (FW-2644)]|nr:hypothetical protein V502_03357 [Pseudogymnoascus sp. VKM F-4520 (FW-2644)]
MVPNNESNYFPPLEECLSNKQLLISWGAAYSCLLHLDKFGTSDSHLESFFSDTQVQKLLARPFHPFSFTQSNTKAAFETKTAAINVAPTSNCEYDINKIKEDSLWLSKEVQIDEVSALRIIVLEYQSRAAAQLKSEFSNEEAVSLQTAAGNINTESSNLLSLALSAAKNAAGGNKSDSDEDRRIRAVQIYLSECQSILACSKLIFHVGFRTFESKGKGLNAETTWIDRVAEAFVTSQEQNPERFLHYCITSLKANFDTLNDGSGWFKCEGGRPNVESEWLQSRVTEAVHSLEISLLILDYRKDTRSGANVLEWFQFMSAYGFFENFSHPDPSLLALTTSIQSLVSVVSLSMLDCQSIVLQVYDEGQTEAPETEDGTPSYITDLETILKIHEVIAMAASNVSTIASPAILAWALILFAMEDLTRKKEEARSRALEATEDDDEGYGLNSSTGQSTATDTGIFAEVIATIMTGQEKESPIHYLAVCAVDQIKVFSVLSMLATTFGASSGQDLADIFDSRIRIIILDVIRCTTPLVQYGEEVVSAALSCLTGATDYWNQNTFHSNRIDENPVTYFMQDDYLMERFLSAAASRYPYESLPFLRLIRAISSCEYEADDGTPAAVQSLENLTCFMFALPHDFRDYQTTQEEENLNIVELTDSVMLFKPRANLSLMYRRTGSGGISTGMEQITNEFCIPAGTQGRIVSERNPRVAVWFYEYSGLKYLGKLLEAGMGAGEYVDAIKDQLASQEDLAEIVSILATLVRTSIRINESNGGTGDSNGAAHRILEQASDGLDRNRDIVLVVFSIFEEELERQAAGSASEANLDLLNACVQFIHALVPVLPGRVWPLIARSGLLDQEGRSGRLTTILSGIEFVNARFDFLLSSAHLFGALIEDLVTHAVLRKGGLKSSAQTGSTDDLGTGVPDHVLSKVTASYTKTLLGVFESACNWRFAIPEQRLLLSKHISTIFDKLLHYNYGIGENPSSGSNLSSSLGPAASQVVETFLSPTSGLLRFQSLFRGFLDGFTTPESTVRNQYCILWIAQVKSILSFTKTLIKVGTLLERSGSQLEGQLFKVSPLIARLYAVNWAYRLPVTTLLEELVIIASANTGEPPSLLAHLGQETSKNFLHMLMQLGKPLNNDDHVIPIWRLLSAVVSNRQQWFAIYLLTGRNPRDNLKGNANCTATSAKSLISIALEELSNIKQIPMPRALAILQFISLAQNYWPWAMKDALKNSDFNTVLLDHVSGFEALAASANTDRSIEGAFQARMAAYVAEILAMHLYHSRQLGNVAPVKDILPKLKYFIRCGVAAPAYNTSLQSNLKRNLEARYPGCNLQSFKFTRLQTQTLGQDYFYNIELANKMLCFHQAWKGKKGDGIIQELIKANVNLSVVDAQISLLRGWEMLAIELSHNLGGTADIGPSVATISCEIARDCLISNTRSQPPEAIFSRLNQTRADFALTLLQKLLQTNPDTPMLKELLPIAWRAIVDLQTTFELALSDGPEAAAYYRTLLKVLFLLLRIHTRKDASDQQFRSSLNAMPAAASANLTIALDILDNIVGQGFRDLATALHQQSGSIMPDDIAIITAILQNCLLMPGMEVRTVEVQGILSKHGTARMATSLFSWADKLAIDGDPIYGELSILFLLELSTIPEIAEQLAVEGVLGLLSSAPLTVYMRRANVGPFADSAGAIRCYSIWARGILPLLLNLLARLETSIAAEVAVFLSQFPNLLDQAEHSLDSSDDERRPGRPRRETRVALLTLSEAHSLALLTMILNSCRGQVPGMLTIPWDATTVLESVEYWLSSRVLLSQRIVPLGLRESELERTGKLEEKVVDELLGLKDVLTQLNEG